MFTRKEMEDSSFVSTSSTALDDDMSSGVYSNDKWEKKMALWEKEETLPEEPPLYDEVMNEGDKNMEEKKMEEMIEEMMKENKDDKYMDKKHEEKCLQVLRAVVRKCTDPNPLKRPTAKEVLKMLEPVAPKDLRKNKRFDFDEDE